MAIIHDLICEYCNQPFQSTRLKRCCSRQHAAQLGLRDRGLEPWHQEELDLLENLSGSAPIHQIVAAVQSLDRARGWCVRTYNAVDVKLKRLKLTKKCIYDNFTRHQLARLLNVAYDRVEAWTQKYGLPYRKISRNKGNIKREDFVRWAKQNPQQLGGIKYSRLFSVVEDEELAKRCSEMPPPKIGLPQPVRNAHTGQEYKSLNQAAQASFVSRHSISSAMQRNGKSAGYVWELIDE